MCRIYLAINLLFYCYFVTGFDLPSINKHDVDVVCCVQSSWEAKLFLDSGTVFIDQNTAFAYFNATVRAAYSLPRQKLYYGISAVEQSPLIPHPYGMNRTILADFAMGTTYSVFNGECEKSEISKNMSQLCIPRDATLVTKAEFGDKRRPMETYQFTSQYTDIPWQITASVFVDQRQAIEPKECEPFHATYFTPSVNPDSGTLYTFDVLDIGPIQSHDIFDIPEACRHLK